VGQPTWVKSNATVPPSTEVTVACSWPGAPSMVPEQVICAPTWAGSEPGQFTSVTRPPDWAVIWVATSVLSVAPHHRSREVVGAQRTGRRTGSIDAPAA
jgi:hypothetical protein